MTTTNNPRVGRRAAALAAGAGTLAFTGAILAAGFGGAGDVRADALCDQMRAQYGPSWPCISVPTYTPPPTMNAPTTTPGAPGTSNGGAVIGGDAGPGPGTGNGTPIVGGQPTEQNRPGRTGAPAGPRTPAPATGTPNRPGQPANNEPTPGRTPAPVGVPVQQSDPSPPDQAFLSPASDDDGGSIPLPVWAIAGAAALAAANPRARKAMALRRESVGSADNRPAVPVSGDAAAILGSLPEVFDNAFKHDAGGYVLKFEGGSGTFGGPDTSDMHPRDVSRLLRECFNCYFPIEGAPREFPKVGDELPLIIDVPGKTFQAPVRVTSVVDTDEDFSFEFLALPGHFDGEGSTIRFHFWNDGHLRMNVYASTTSFWAPPGFINSRAGEIIWGQFFSNVVAGLS